MKPSTQAEYSLRNKVPVPVFNVTEPRSELVINPIVSQRSSESAKDWIIIET